MLHAVLHDPGFVSCSLIGLHTNECNRCFFFFFFCACLKSLHIYTVELDCGAFGLYRGKCNIYFCTEKFLDSEGNPFLKISAEEKCHTPSPPPTPPHPHLPLLAFPLLLKPGVHQEMCIFPFIMLVLQQGSEYPVEPKFSILFWVTVPKAKDCLDGLMIKRSRKGNALCLTASWAKWLRHPLLKSSWPRV